MANDRIIIGYFPDTIVTSFVDKTTFVSLNYLSELQVRFPGMSYDNPIASATVGQSTGTICIKPLVEATDEDLVNIANAVAKGSLTSVIERMMLIKNVGP